MLWSFAVAKPLFDILGDSPEFFVARENTSGDIVVLALVLTLVPPTVLYLVELPFSRARRAGKLVHLAFVALLAAAVAVQVLKDISGSTSAMLVPVALALGGAGAVAYDRVEAVRTGLGLLAPLPLVFVVAFLFFSPVTDLVLPEDGDAAAARAEPARPVPIVIVVFDELSGSTLMDSRGRLDASRYPNFARLAADATWYPNATTVADHTSQALPPVLTGNRPEEGALPTSSDQPENLFRLLGDRYDFNVEEPVTDLCPPDLCGEETAGGGWDRFRQLVSDLGVVSLHRLLPDELRDGLPAVDQAFSDFGGAAGDGGGGTGDSRVLSAALRGLEDRSETFARFVRRAGRRTEKPPLDFIHTELPHIPWEYLPSGQLYLGGEESPPGLEGDVWTGDERVVRQAQQRYLLQVGYIDRLVGRLLDRLRATGSYESSLVVVTADHGTAFQPGAHRRQISRSAFTEIAGVPLFVKAPGQHRGKTDGSAARTIDIAPTVAAALGERLPWRADGRALRASPAQRSRPVWVFASFDPVPRLDFRRYVRLRDATVARDVAWFGSRDRGRGIFAPGTGPSVVGRAVAGLPADPPVRARAELDDAHAFTSIPAGAAHLPGLVSGRISPGLSTGPRLAVAINGRVAAVTLRSDGKEGTDEFEAIVDPRTLRAGANDVSVYVLRQRGGAFRLAPLAQQAGETYRLVTRGERQLIVDSTGRRRVVSDLVQGSVDSLALEDDVLRALGWAAQPRLGPAEKVLVFVDGRFQAAAVPSKPRPDVAREHGRSTLASGFSIAGSAPAGATRQDVRVFALRGARASELPR